MEGVAVLSIRPGVGTRIAVLSGDEPEIGMRAERRMGKIVEFAERGQYRHQRHGQQQRQCGEARHEHGTMAGRTGHGGEDLGNPLAASAPTLHAPAVRRNRGAPLPTVRADKPAPACYGRRSIVAFRDVPMLRTPAHGQILRQLIAGSALVLLTACVDTPTADSAPAVVAPPPATPGTATAPTVAAPPALPAATPVAASFEDWRDGFRNEALANGIQPQLFDQAFAGVAPDPTVISADRSQPEFTRPVWTYLEGALAEKRVRSGKTLLSQHTALLERIEARYGVDRQALVAVWGMESNFGQVMGSKSVIRSLATLAFEGRRPQFAHDQLLAALSILQNGDVRPERMIGSWAGAMGQTQFIPTTYLSHAVDFDGDGRRDIWDSTADALASTAHYLQASGWRRGQPWGFEVRLPQGFDYALADMTTRKSLHEWRQSGVALPTTAVQDGEQASLLLPAGHRGPAFLVLDNFRSVLKYNNSTSYALAIGLLGERFQNRGQIVAAWPLGDTPLSRSERIELQNLLASNGFDPGSADGIIGANTRKAVRSLQQRLGWPADGYPTSELLKALRQQ
ncbi:membrane-bound lytic murein transglycosylase B [Azotobacter vinelandii]|nr:membrane-bound lytic murein transglycosylase B [Azotobacter vinelandii]